MLSSESLRASNYDTYPSSVLRTMLTGLIGSQIALSISADKSQLSAFYWVLTSNKNIFLSNPADNTIASSFGFHLHT